MKKLEELLDLYGENIDLTPGDFLQDELTWDKSIKKYIEELDDKDLDLPTDKEDLINILENFEFKESEGGPEMGLAASAVYYFPNIDKYIMFYGDYYSYDGYTYEGMKEVKPKDVVITKYF
jgi:hypothetical protein